MNQDAPPPYPGTDLSAGKSYGSHQQQTTVISQPCYTVVQQFRETPVRTQCQFCSADVVTSTFYEIGTLTWLACFVIFWVCPFGCCLFPFCMDMCKDVVHKCPNCHQQVGRYSRI